MYRDDQADPPALVCRVGATTLTYHVSAIDDLAAWLREQGDWVPPRRRGRAEAGRRWHRGGVGSRSDRAHEVRRMTRSSGLLARIAFTSRHRPNFVAAPEAA
ncbi:DUF6855 family protein [Microbacterium sp. DT81.1]